MGSEVKSSQVTSQQTKCLKRLTLEVMMTLLKRSDVLMCVLKLGRKFCSTTGFWTLSLSLEVWLSFDELKKCCAYLVIRSIPRSPAKCVLVLVAQVLSLCVRHEFLPAIVFCFSKGTCEDLAKAVQHLPALTVGLCISKRIANPVAFCIRAYLLFISVRRFGAFCVLGTGLRNARHGVCGC